MCVCVATRCDLVVDATSSILMAVLVGCFRATARLSPLGGPIRLLLCSLPPSSSELGPDRSRQLGCAPAVR